LQGHQLLLAAEQSVTKTYRVVPPHSPDGALQCNVYLPAGILLAGEILTILCRNNNNLLIFKIYQVFYVLTC